MANCSPCTRSPAPTAWSPGPPPGCTLIAGGFDALSLIATDVGHAAREPEYVGTANAFSTGTRDGVRSWLRHCAAAVEVAAAELDQLTQA